MLGLIMLAERMDSFDPSDRPGRGKVGFQPLWPACALRYLTGNDTLVAVLASVVGSNCVI